MVSRKRLCLEDFQKGLSWVRKSPQNRGIVKAIVIRPSTNSRKELQSCGFSPEMGVQGDYWSRNCWLKQQDGSPHPNVQVAMMNVRVIDLLTQERSLWKLAGDQLYIDFDLSKGNVSAGQRLKIGTVVLEITGRSHTGCKKFSDRFGSDALKFVNSSEGNRLRLRGIYAKIVRSGLISVGNYIQRI